MTESLEFCCGVLILQVAAVSVPWYSCWTNLTSSRAITSSCCCTICLTSPRLPQRRCPLSRSLATWLVRTERLFFFLFVDSRYVLLSMLISLHHTSSCLLSWLHVSSCTFHHNHAHICVLYVAGCSWTFRFPFLYLFFFPFSFRMWWQLWRNASSLAFHIDTLPSFIRSIFSSI